MAERRRPSKKDADALAARLASKLARSDRWNGLAAGDLVKVRGEHGARFLFRAHVVNTTNGAAWVELDELARPGRGAARPERDAVGSERPVIRRQRSVDPSLVVAVPRAKRAPRPAAQGVQQAFPFGLVDAATPDRVAR